MSLIAQGQEIINSYNENELLAKVNSPVHLSRSFSPKTFYLFNFLTHMNSAEEFWKLADSMQEFRTEHYAHNLMNEFSEDELNLIKDISLDIGGLTKSFNRKTIPIGINHQLSSIPTVRILQQLKNINNELSSVLEIGGGSGMLGHMCHRLGFKYSNFDITQSFYTFNSTFFKHLYKDKFTDTHLIKTDDSQYQKKSIDNEITMIPWWHFANLEFHLPKFRIVVMNHTFFEITKKAMAFIITRLANSIDGRVYLVVSGWGSGRFTELDNSFLQWLEKEFDFRKEDIVGNSKINPNGTVLLSFQKTKSSTTDIYSLSIEERLSMFKTKQKNKHPSKFRRFLSPYIPTNVKKLILKIFLKNKVNTSPHVLGDNKPSISSVNFNAAPYKKNYEDLKRLIYEIEEELGKPSYTEDEALGYYISRQEHA